MEGELFTSTEAPSPSQVAPPNSPAWRDSRVMDLGGPYFLPNSAAIFSKLILVDAFCTYSSSCEASTLTSLSSMKLKQMLNFTPARASPVLRRQGSVGAAPMGLVEGKRLDTSAVDMPSFVPGHSSWAWLMAAKQANAVAIRTRREGLERCGGFHCEAKLVEFLRIRAARCQAIARKGDGPAPSASSSWAHTLATAHQPEPCRFAHQSPFQADRRCELRAVCVRRIYYSLCTNFWRLEAQLHAKRSKTFKATFLLVVPIQINCGCAFSEYRCQTCTIENDFGNRNHASCTFKCEK